MEYFTLVHRYSQFSQSRVSLEYGMPSTEISDCDLSEYPLTMERQQWASKLVHILIALLPFVLAAQVISSSVVGDAQDASGAAVPGAAVVITNISTGAVPYIQHRRGRRIRLPATPAGRLQLCLRPAPDSNATKSRKINLPVNQTVRVDIRLVVGEVSEQVQVTAQAVQLESETSSLGQVVVDREHRRASVEWPQFHAACEYLPGCGRRPTTRRSATITNQSGRSDMAVHISGGRGDTNSYLIDGVETRSSWFNSPSVLFSVDAIQEFKIDRNLFTAEYGQGSGIVSLVSKSGGNGFHGSAFEFLRNDAFDAANFFDNYFGNPKAPFRQNQFGASAGGPIIKNRLFFFANWESLRSRRSNTMTALVPTPAQLSGDLTGLTSTKRDPATNASAILDPSTGQPFPGNRIPSSRISSVTRNFIKYTPQPNANIGGRNYVVTKSTNRDDDQFGVRMDYQISASDRSSAATRTTTPACSGRGSASSQATSFRTPAEI